MRLRAFKGKECGSVSEFHNNTCFYNCLYEEICRMKIEHCYPLTYSTFIELGKWNESQKGKMIDTCEHEAQIQLVAQVLGLHIRVYTEIAPNIVNEDIFMEFGVIDPLEEDCIKIVKLMNVEHFVVLQHWIDDDVNKSAQIASDEMFAKKLQATPSPDPSPKLSRSINEPFVHPKPFDNSFNLAQNYDKYTRSLREAASTLDQFHRNIELAQKDLEEVKYNLIQTQNNLRSIHDTLEKGKVPEKIKALQREAFVWQLFLMIVVYMYLVGKLNFT